VDKTGQAVCPIVIAHNKTITVKLKSHINYYEFRLDLNHAVLT